jgi:hypothetical protein
MLYKEKYCQPISVYKELTFVKFDEILKLIIQRVQGVQNYR